VKKRFLTIFLSIILCLGAMAISTGCAPNRPFTVTFLPNKEGAMISEEFKDLGVYDEIKYLNDDGVHVEYVKQTVKSAKQLVLPIFISSESYHDGWDKIISKISKTTSIKAQWSNAEFTVTFASGVREAELVSTDVPLVQTVKSPLNLVFPTWSRDGYSMHWENTDTIRESCTLTPVWTANEYQITFVDEDGVTELCPKKTVSYGSVIGELPVPTSQDREFGAWRLKDEHRFIFADKVYDYTKDLILQAIWCGSDAGLIEYVNVGEYDGDISYPFGQEFTLAKPTKTGYIFLGWTGDGISGDQPVLDYTIPANCMERSLTFTAHWQADEYTAHFDAGANGTVEIASKKMTFDQAVGELPQPTKEGFVFDCWTLNGLKIDQNYVWDVANNSAILVATYKRVYTIRYVLTYKERGTSVYAEFDKQGQSQAEKLGMVQVEDYVWELSGVIEGTIIPDYPSTKAIGEYSFSSWKFGKTDTKRGNTIKPGTVINEKNFANTYESGIITLTVHCISHWSPPIT